MSRFDVMIGNARVKSTKSQIRISYNGETIKLNKRKLKRFFLKLAAFVICLNIVGKVADAAWEKIDYQHDVIVMRNVECIETEDLLLRSGLHTEPLDDGEWHNNYSNIDGLSKDDIYGFYHYCGPKETEKVLQALGYDSWKNFCSMEGYFDNGFPSVEVWENYAEYDKVEEHREELENVRRC